MEVERKQFKLFLRPEEFLNRVDCSSAIRKLIEDTDGIIAPKDMGRMVSSKEGTPGMKAVLKIGELRELIRSIPDNRGKKVYSKATIRTGEISQSLVLNYQTFAQGDKILSIYKLNNFFRHFDFAGMANAEACVLTCEGKRGKYAAIYVPPIIEYLPKETLQEPLDNLIRRAEHEESITLPTSEGNGTIYLKDVVRDVTQEIMDNPEIKVVHALRDGTHRASLTNLAGTTLHVIEINGSMAMPPSVLRNTSDIIITTEKPKLEDRFLGIRIEQGKPEAQAVGWLNLKYVGIDG